MFVFKYQVGQDAVIPLSFTPKVLNVNEVEVIWEFKSISDGEMETVRWCGMKIAMVHEHVQILLEI